MNTTPLAVAAAPPRLTEPQSGFVCGATSGDNPSKAELTKIFFKPVRVIGSVMGTHDELISLTRMLIASGVRPQIDRILPLTDAKAGFAAMIAGDHFGKIIIEP